MIDQNINAPNFPSEAPIPNFDAMTPAQFEEYLPDYFAAGGSNVSADPGFQTFLDRNPDCAALVHDLEAIAQAAISILPVHDPSDSVWSKIKQSLGDVGLTSPLTPEVE